MKATFQLGWQDWVAIYSYMQEHTKESFWWALWARAITFGLAAIPVIIVFAIVGLVFYYVLWFLLVILTITVGHHSLVAAGVLFVLVVAFAGSLGSVIGRIRARRDPRDPKRRFVEGLVDRDVRNGKLKLEWRYQVTISAEGVHEVANFCHTKGGVEFLERKETIASWAMIRAIDATEHHAFLTLHEHQCFVVPAHAFAFPDEFRAFVDEARRFHAGVSPAGPSDKSRREETNIQTAPGPPRLAPKPVAVDEEPRLHKDDAVRKGPDRDQQILDVFRYTVYAIIAVLVVGTLLGWIFILLIT